jgi:uncharacterized protein
MSPTRLPPSAIRTDHKLRAVFDTNIVVSALVFGGRLSWLRAAWAAQTVVPVVCRETVTELLRVLAYPKFRLTPEDRNTLLAQYLPFCETVTLPSVWPKLPAACRDRDDAVFIALMLSARADLLVSGDADLTVLRDTVRVVSVTDLRVMLDSDG